jgi:hypothetical protein
VTLDGPHDEGGGVAPVLLLPVVVAALIALVLATGLGAVLLTAGRAEDAADEAALEVVRALVAGVPRPCDAAGRVAAGAVGEVTVLACGVTHGTATVRVAVAVPTPLLQVAGTRPREASASARVVWPSPEAGS